MADEKEKPDDSLTQEEMARAAGGTDQERSAVHDLTPAELSRATGGTAGRAPGRSRSADLEGRKKSESPP